jgi:hypothetical protein
MADYAVGTSDDGLRYAVNRLVKDPAFIPARLEADVTEQYFARKLLRQGPPMPGGSIVFEESEGSFADDDPEILEEYAEIPLTQAKRGKLHTAYGARYGRGLRISRQTVRRNNYDQLSRDMTKLKNNFARVDENRAVTALLAGLGTFTGNNWTTSTGTGSSDMAESVFSDVAKVVFNIKNADADSSNGTGSAKLRFKPDTIVLNPMLATKLMFNRDIINALSVGAVAGRNPLLTSEAVEAFTNAFGLKPVLTDSLNLDKAIILEAGTVGFVSEEDALHFSPLEYHPSTASYDTYGERTWAVAIDQPKAGIVITGVNGGSATLANFTG